MLHWINAFEDGHKIVVDGFFERNPALRIDPSTAAWSPGRDDAERWMFRFLDATTLDPVPYRWRLDLAHRGWSRRRSWWTPSVSSERSVGGISVGPTATATPSYRSPVGSCSGAFVVSTSTPAAPTTCIVDDGVFVSEAQLAPRPDAPRQDDGYVVTFTTDVNEDRSECLVFDATHLAAGPVARVQLPERICTGSHSCWMPSP